jgi:hypothetical protein
MSKIVDGISFDTKSWDSVWKEELEKFKDLKDTDNLKKRIFFQKNNFLFVKYIYESGISIILPMEVIENV